MSIFWHVESEFGLWYTIFRLLEIELGTLVVVIRPLGIIYRPPGVNFEHQKSIRGSVIR